MEVPKLIEKKIAKGKKEPAHRRAMQFVEARSVIESELQSRKSVLIDSINSRD